MRATGWQSDAGQGYRHSACCLCFIRGRYCIVYRPQTQSRYLGEKGLLACFHSPFTPNPQSSISILFRQIGGVKSHGGVMGQRHGDAIVEVIAAQAFG